ncbi:hypothetical protein Ddc_11695 [Ditylenchus destructor]|nr:hypothetical protein Ddc_11695 [Ditylenchus destructor]
MKFLFQLCTLLACFTIGCLGNVYHQTNCVEQCEHELKIDKGGLKLLENYSHAIEDEINSTILSQVCQITEKYVVCLEKNCDIAQYRSSKDSNMQDIYRDISDTIHKYRLTSPACENFKEWPPALKCIKTVFNARPHSETGKPLYNLMYNVKELGSKCKAELEAMPQIYEQVSKSCGKNATNLYIRVHKSAMISFAHLRGLAMTELPSECSDFLSYINDALANDYKSKPYHQTNCVEHCKQELKIDAEGSRLISRQSLVIMEESNSTLISQITEKYVGCLEKNCDIAQYRNSNDSKMKYIFRDFSVTIHRYRMTSPACENVKEWASSAKCIDTVYDAWTGPEFAKPMYDVTYDVEKLGEVCKAQLEIMPQIEERFSKSCGNNATILLIRFYKNAMISFADLRGFKMAELPSACSDFLSYVNDVLSNDYKANLYYKIVHYVSSVFGLKKFLI